MMLVKSRMSLRLLLVGCVVGLSGSFVASAGASQLIDRNAQRITLGVNNAGIAMVSFMAAGKVHHVLARGAINALPPTEGSQQVTFQLDYAGGWGFFHKMNYWKKFRNGCLPYDGPALAWFVAGCSAPDGSYWALQKWQRALPNYGLIPVKAKQRVWELRLSHWDTDLPKLDIYLDWAYHEHFDHLFGVLTYNGNGVYGFGNTPSGRPTDSWGRNIYVDTYNSRYGKGWKRENSFLTHGPPPSDGLPGPTDGTSTDGTSTDGSGNTGGGFCYGFYPHKANGKMRPVGKGEKYRATVIGPGVTPDVFWQGTPVPYSEDLDTQANAKRLELLGDDSRCTSY